ncbi:hypothetical protein SSP24_55490 [Streptomyces spinoverrucosus]|uniref:Uncharacterized protein n=1 Tax=Streptomyces spinoverrucosus TaxID=284043 RepID=A0A4Y3VLV1_9ACTN|nr:DUF4132 domain-containing protein [Streptomyces spinoverrucosus]GEC07894.1 hypothetical protein SSP24_55490 [Streptomyces spinoverrucosus]GHB86056.1 hypothetical protein GCM10010397_67050 [Streptomyces spinoverrucosus]
MITSTSAFAAQVRGILDLIAAGDAEGAVPELLTMAETIDDHWSWEGRKVFDALRDADRRFQAALVHHLAARYHDVEASAVVRRRIVHLLDSIEGAELVEDQPRDTRSALIRLTAERDTQYDTDQLIRLAELELAEGRDLPGDFVALIRRSHLLLWNGASELGDLVKRLTHPVLNPGEAWSDQALADLSGRGEDWHRLLAHAATATSARPTAKWERTGRSLIDAVGPETVRERVLPWLGLVGRPRTRPLLPEYYGANPNDTLDPYNATALRGLTWLLSFLPAHAETARILGALVETCLKKVAGLGPRNPKVANAAVNALARIDGEAALAELARLTTRVTYKGTLKLLDTALDTRAEALGLGRDEIEELAVPAYGLTDVGHARYAFGDATAELRVDGTRAVLSWQNAAGRPVKAVPAAVRRDHADELKELKAAVKDIDKMLTAQSERLDRQFLTRRTWTYAAWRERYLDHPLVGTLARRLLWTVDGTTVGYADGALRTLTDDPVTHGTEVELWHPVGHEPAHIVAWRDWLERHSITQPFKQAHREVYLLTDAERTTHTYSNRFAAHILRQHQFHALAAIRGWRNKLRLCVDDEAPPATRELPQWGLRAEYWIEGEGENYGVDTTESGSYLRLRTDQVRFYPIDAPENSAHCCGGEYRMWLRDGADPVDPIPLADIPPLVLSEVLRDVDLFVGVASVGNDPTWQDGGPDGRFREYWTSYGFGELGQSAETRRALLERLIPRLAIAGRCTLEGRFLQVKGERHMYKIHLGSGNILMSPNDQYLCIVPKSTPGAPQAGYLPYEGDRMLAVILSKAMMLADDTKITDPTILSQL